MNPCPCGYRGDGTSRCSCAPARVHAYHARISGPLLDRFDMHVEVPAVPFAELTRASMHGESQALRERVVDARRRQLEERGVLNARLGDAALWQALKASKEAELLLRRAAEQWRLSARSTVRILRVARTIGDLAGAERVEAEHLAEALQLRCRDRPL
jgi:magnesium chelatase family protein